MMTEIHKALYTFWSGFSIPAYLTGHVPDGAAMPYITFEVVASEPFQMSTVSAICWYKAESGKNVNNLRAQKLDQIANAIPVEGKVISLTSGKLFLTRNPTFQTYYDDPEDRSVIGGLTSYQIRYYTR